MRIALDANSRISLPVGNGSREYVIDDAIGSGATCIVYSAHYQDAIGHRRDVRIKECYPYDAQITRNGQVLHWNDNFEQDAMLERFRNAYQKLSEMQNTQGLRNSTAHVFDLCEANGTLYSVMDISDGTTFTCDNEASLQGILKTTLALTRVIEKYHANGYLHLDIKPDNFLVIPETRELVILFDVDTVTALEDISAGKVTNIPYSKNWAAPEQMQGKIHKLCPATDLYAIGAILFERVFGHPVSSEDMGIFAKWDYDESLCASENPKIRRLMTELFHKTLSANIRNRYRSANELAAALEETIRVVDKGTPYLVTTAPTSHINFVGRREELQRISNTFENGKKSIFLQGFGGIGKTELAKKYAETYADNYDHVAFLRYSEKQRSIKSLLLDNIQIANYEDDRNDNEIERRKKRLEKIKELLTRRVLIILDNYDVETPDSELMDLLDWNASLLVTTRTDFFYLDGQTAQLSVAQMDFTDLLEVFCRESRQAVTEEQKSNLEKLFAQFDNYTMVVTLLAKQVYAAGLTIEDLCGSEDVYDYEERVISTKDFAVTQDTLMGHLQRVFNMAALSEEHQETLRTIWLMQGANGLITKQFYKKYSGMSLNPLNSLISLGWLQYDNNDITFHPIIEELVERNLRPTCQNCPHLYQTFLQKLSTLRKAIDADDSTAFSGETERLFRIYAFMHTTDMDSNENLLTLSLCLLDLYEQYEVPEFMWFVGWENQDYFFFKVLQTLSAAKSATNTENCLLESKRLSELFSSAITLYAASLCCDFCRLQFENLQSEEYSGEDLIDKVVILYGTFLLPLLDFARNNKQTGVPVLQRQIDRIAEIDNSTHDFSGSIFMKSCSIWENGEYHDEIECDYARGIVPHRNRSHWEFYIFLCASLSLIVDLFPEDERHTQQYQEYNRALNRMNTEILRAGAGYNHFYDFYDIPEEKHAALFKSAISWDETKHLIHSGKNYFDESDTEGYFREIIDTVEISQNPYYLYKLILNYDFRLSDECKELLLKWDIGKQIAEDHRLSNKQKRFLAEFAIENYNPGEPDFVPNLQGHCICSILKNAAVSEKTKYGVYSAIARKYIEDIVRFAYGWDHGEIDEVPAFSECYPLMQYYYPLKKQSPNRLCGVADAIFTCQTKQCSEYSPEEFSKSYAEYISKMPIEKLTKWDEHWGYIGIAHIVGKEAGARIVVEHLAPKLLAYFAKNDPAEYFETADEIRRIKDKYAVKSNGVVNCFHCQQLVSLDDEVCPYCNSYLF